MKKVFLLLVPILLAGPTTANAYIYGEDAQCNQDAYNYALVMTHGHTESPFFEGYHDSYELTYCNAGIDS